jgi:predicted transcriptional regulator of viral defense system
MDFADLLQIVGDAPLFETGLLLAGNVDPANVRRQLSRWTAAGKLHQLRRGLYALAPPYQKVVPHPFLVANRLVEPSYVSLQAALAFHHLIPEHVPWITSVTTARPGQIDTPLAACAFHHVKTSRFYGYQRQLLDAASAQHAFIALPEKALLDQVYLQPGGDALDALRGLRLQNLDTLDVERLRRLAARAASPKLARAARNVATLIAQEKESGYETLP